MLKYLDEHKDEMLALWQDLVNHESGVGNKAGIDQLQKKLASLLEDWGAHVRVVEYEKAGNTLVADIESDPSKAPIVLLGHVDTVFPLGESEKRPFTIRDGKAFGPGVLDMKGGVVVLLYAVKALLAQNYAGHPLKIILVGDEENGHAHSAAKDLLAKEAAGAVAAFNCETGYKDEFVIGRKGIAQYELQVEGVAAHAGNDPEKGASAIVEIAHKLLEIYSLNNPDAGLTVNVGVIEGGIASNVVPDKAKILIDVRYLESETYRHFHSALEAIVAETHVKGCVTGLSLKGGMPGMPATEGNKRLFSLVESASLKLGHPGPQPRISGGGSDSVFPVSVGVPTVCAMGVIGARNHSAEEYALVDSLFERAELLSQCILELSAARI